LYLTIGRDPHIFDTGLGPLVFLMNCDAFAILVPIMYGIFLLIHVLNSYIEINKNPYVKNDVFWGHQITKEMCIMDVVSDCQPEYTIVHLKGVSCNKCADPGLLS
jgi:hypothetical protein